MNFIIFKDFKFLEVWELSDYPGLDIHMSFQELEAGGKPSTWFPPGGLVELITHYDN